MPVKRDANGRFATGSGSRPSKGKKLAKIAGHKKAVQTNKNAQHNLAQVRRKAENTAGRAFRTHNAKTGGTADTKAALTKAEAAVSKISSSGKAMKLITEQRELGQKSNLGGKRVFEFTAADARKKALAKKAKKAGK